MGAILNKWCVVILILNDWWWCVITSMISISHKSDHQENNSRRYNIFYCHLRFHFLGTTCIDFTYTLICFPTWIFSPSTIICSTLCQHEFSSSYLQVYVITLTQISGCDHHQVIHPHEIDISIAFIPICRTCCNEITMKGRIMRKQQKHDYVMMWEGNTELMISNRMIIMVVVLLMRIGVVVLNVIMIHMKMIVMFTGWSCVVSNCIKARNQLKVEMWNEMNFELSTTEAVIAGTWFGQRWWRGTNHFRHWINDWMNYV